jgi:hypothetical protein
MMGWSENTGLGKSNQGMIAPVNFIRHFPVVYLFF